VNIRWLGFLAALSTSTARAQSPASPAQPPLTGTAASTITGCVTGTAGALPIVLVDAMTLPYGSAAVAPESVAGDAFALPIPEGAAGETSRLPPPVTPTGTPGAASSLGTIDLGSATIGVGTKGTSRTPPTPVGTSGLSATTASASASAPAGAGAAGYRLSGVNMTSWIGRRVQITGVVVPSTATGETAAAEETEEGELPMPEFRVVSVQPVTGPCPK
jgi:hypothetical protein